MAKQDEGPGQPIAPAPGGLEPNGSAGDGGHQATNITATPKVSDAPFMLDGAQPLAPTSFPNQPRAGTSQIPTTIPNVKHLLKSYGIAVRYNTIKKRLTITIPGQLGTLDNAGTVALGQIYSLAALNGMAAGQVATYVCNIADRNQYNPVADWITGKPWDGVDRLPQLYGTLVQREDYPETLKQTLLLRWLLSAVAAALKPSGFRSRGVLTLQGPQGIGKTAWVSALIPDPSLRESVLKLDHHLDAGNKDSHITAITHWIVEIGELESSFRKDVARLKGFLTSDYDKVRRPYGQTDSEYPRRTVFCATVNDPNFLVDSTGNSRWWTIPLVEVNYSHGIDMQQLFAQLVHAFNASEPWWLTRAEETQLEIYNKDHRTISAIQERVLEAVDLNRVNEPNLPAMTSIQVLIRIGVKNPGNMQCREGAAVLREHLGDPKKINGYYKWRVPLKESAWPSSTSPAVSDEDF